MEDQPKESQTQAAQGTGQGDTGVLPKAEVAGEAQKKENGKPAYAELLPGLGIETGGAKVLQLFS